MVAVDHKSVHSSSLSVAFVSSDVDFRVLFRRVRRSKSSHKRNVTISLRLPLLCLCTAESFNGNGSGQVKSHQDSSVLEATGKVVDATALLFGGYGRGGARVSRSGRGPGGGGRATNRSTHRNRRQPPVTETKQTRGQYRYSSSC